MERFLDGKLAWVVVLSVGALGGVAWGQEQAGRKESTKAADDEGSSSFIHNFNLEFAPQFETGTFGAKGRSSFLYLPAILGYDQSGVVANLTVPYEVERSRVSAIFLGGRTIRTSGQKKGKIITEAGLGDIYLDAGYYVFERRGNWPSLLVEGEVKFPTADDERGLGTGSYDETILVSSSATYFEHLKLYGEVGYGFIGQPEDIPVSVQKFHDTIYYSAAVGYAFSKANELWARIDGNTRITDGTPPYQLFSIEWDHYFKNESKLYFSLGFGLTNATPGLALTLGYQFWF